MPEPSPPTAPRVEVRRSRRRRRTVTAFREGDTVVVVVPDKLPGAEERRLVDDVLARLLARERRTRPPRTDAGLADRAQRLGETYLAPVLGEAPRPVAVTWVANQQQRWGSCTPASGTIRLSDRLRTMPDWVVDYVLLHELVHLVEPGHSERFWGLVARFPRAERAQGFLEGFAVGRGQGVDEHAG